MDGSQFDGFLRGLTSARSRRGAIVGLLGIALGLVGLTDTEAKHHKKKHKKRGGGGSPPASPPTSAPPAPPCVAEPAESTCVGHCDTTRVNNCGQAVTCACPTGESCLVNGSCALACTSTPECPPTCLCNGPSTEGQYHCLRFGGSCDALQTCTATGGPTGCPPGFHCQPCMAFDNLRCVQLCTS